MSFFLLGQGPEGELRLISRALFSTRQEALAELSTLTAAPGFEHWDAEVLVMELASGTPVLLVRPATAEPAVDTEPDSSVESVVDVDSDSGPETAVDTGSDSGAEVVTEEGFDEAAETLVDVEDEPSADREPVEEVDHDLAQVLEGLESDEALADAAADEPELRDDAVVVQADEVITSDGIVDSAGSVVVDDPVTQDPQIVSEPADIVDEAPAEPEEPISIVTEDDGPLDPEEPTSLRDALKRTAERMESEGIVAPESVGPAEEAAFSDTPEATPADEPAADVPAWPWDTGAAAKNDSFSVPAIEEPAHDVSPLVHGLGDEETMHVSKPVILGSYEGREPASPAEDPSDTIAAPAEHQAEAPAEVAGGADEAIPAGLPDTDELSESDFILDLEELPAPAAPEPSSAGAVADPLADDAARDPEPATDPQQTGMTATPGGADQQQLDCEDCVYVRTCPNKDQRDPRTCGSFQWK